jgi:hypothetical protein
MKSRSRSLVIGIILLLLAGAAILVFHGINSSKPSTVSSSIATLSSGSAGRSGSGGGNARSGPAAGGAAGTVASVSTTGFTMSTAGGQTVTVNESAYTKYLLDSNSASASTVTPGITVLVLGTTNNTTITATQIIVQPTGNYGSEAASAAGVVSFRQGAPSTSKQAGQIPSNYTEGSGTIVSGTVADKAIEAALAVYPGGIVDRVVQISNNEYEVHNIGVNWPHHVFVNQDFKVVGAD